MHLLLVLKVLVRSRFNYFIPAYCIFYLGSPSNALRGREFSKFHPVHVAPTHPDFATETAGGIATLVIVCLLGLLLLIIPIVLMKIYHVGPFKPS